MRVNAVSQSDWEAAAGAVLRKQRLLASEDPDSLVWERLQRRTVEGIALTPLGVPEDLGEVPSTRRNLKRGPWDIRVRTTGGAAALDELENGANSLWLSLPGAATVTDIASRLDGVLTDLAPVVLDTTEPTARRPFCEWLGSTGVRPAQGTGLGADPIGHSFSRGFDTVPEEARERRLEGQPPEVGEIAELALAAGILGFTVDGTTVHDRGAGDAQEVGYTLASGVAYLREIAATGVAIDDAFGLIEFRYAATDEQFVTIAKLRAARQLWARVAELCDADPASGRQRQHAVTSRPMMTRYDPWVNMLRTTVAAFAAGVAGADAITVTPFDAALGESDDFARRIARNTSSLLIEESHAAKAADPVAGAYAVERLTSDLATAAWAEFGRIEAAGGVRAAIADGSLARRVAETATRRRDQVARRQRPVTGVSQFPKLHETLPERAPHPNGTWLVDSYAADFEALRDLPVAHVGLVTMGPRDEHHARETFATNLFQAGGFAIGEADPPQVVCLVGTDAAYAESGAEVIAGLRAAGARHVVLMGRPGDLAVDDSFALGDDAVAFLRRTRQASR